MCASLQPVLCDRTELIYVLVALSFSVNPQHVINLLDMKMKRSLRNLQVHCSLSVRKLPREMRSAIYSGMFMLEQEGA